MTYGIYHICGIGSVLDDEKPVVDIRSGGQLLGVVLEDKIMLYVITFLGGAMLGGIFGVFTMCMMTAAGQADDREEKWFDDQSKKNHR